MIVWNSLGRTGVEPGDVGLGEFLGRADLTADHDGVVGAGDAGVGRAGRANEAAEVDKGLVVLVQDGADTFGIGGVDRAVELRDDVDHAAVDAAAVVEIVDQGVPDAGLIAPTRRAEAKFLEQGKVEHRGTDIDGVLGDPAPRRSERNGLLGCIVGGVVLGGGVVGGRVVLGGGVVIGRVVGGRAGPVGGVGVLVLRAHASAGDQREREECDEQPEQRRMAQLRHGSPSMGFACRRSQARI